MIPSIFGYFASSAAPCFCAVAGSQFVTGQVELPVSSFIAGCFLNTAAIDFSCPDVTGLPAGPPRNATLPLPPSTLTIQFAHIVPAAGELQSTYVTKSVPGLPLGSAPHGTTFAPAAVAALIDASCA